MRIFSKRWSTAQIAEQMQRHAVARNFRRAAELITIPDARILEITTRCARFVLHLRNYRRLPMNWNIPHATVNAAFVRESAEVYQQRNKLRKGSQ